MLVLRPFEKELRHLPLNPTRLKAIASLREAGLKDLPNQPLIEERTTCGIDDKEEGQHVSDRSQRFREAEPIRVDPGFKSGFRHQRPDDIRSDQQAVEFLDYTDGFLTPQRTAYEPLMGINLINNEFDLPPLVIEIDPIQSGSNRGIPHRRHQTMALLVAGTFGIGQDILDHSDEDIIDLA